jgi:hypothetical protein
MEVEMPLYDTGERTEVLTGPRALAKDQEDRRVIVSASHEVIKQVGWDGVWGSASDKFDRGDYEKVGDTPIVRVTTDDLPRH